jgi:creatinine amidohydrolase
MLLENLTWPEVKGLKVENKIVVFPLGSFEQHGHHLPLTTDTDIVTGIARRVEQERPEKVLCLPTLWPGHSTHHLFFPGTLSVSQFPYIQMMTELCHSIAKMGAKKVFLLNGHGGNDLPVKTAMRELKTDFPSIQFVFASYWSLASETIKNVRESGLGGLGHACEMETSVMLYLHPERVKMNLAKPDGRTKFQDTYRKTEMMHSRPIYLVNEFHEISDTGTVGFPESATAEKGERFVKGIVQDVTAFVDDFAKW